MHVFLDIDGVVATEDTWDAWYATGSDPDRRHELLDRTCAAFVQQLCDRLEARVVISSSWRRLYAMDDLVTILKRGGLALNVVGATPVRDDFDRGLEIHDYLAEQGIPVADIVILEDAEELDGLEHRTVRPWFCGDDAGFRAPQYAAALALVEKADP
ncbi:MAG: HAD domain-containing protein [Myxococcota bacterium]